MPGHFLPGPVGPLAVAWTFGATTLGGGAVAGVLLGNAGGM